MEPKTSKRQREIIEYLQSQDMVSTSDLLDKFHIKKATLSEDISLLKKQGFAIERPKRGFLQLVPIHNLPSSHVHEPIRQSTIRQWFTLFVLRQSDKALSIREIEQQYIKHGIENYSIYMLRKDLKNLETMQYVHIDQASKEHLYTCTDKFPILTTLTEEAFDYLCYSMSQYQHSTPMDNEMDILYRRISPIYLGTDNDFDISSNYYVHGKRNHLSPHLHKTLQNYLSFPYKQKQLDITYLTRAQQTLTCTFSTGLIVYNIEKNQIYLLGETTDFKTIIPLENIQHISITDYDNNIYISKEYQEILEEMFSLSIEPAEHVKVRFENKPFIAEKIRNLHQHRKHSTLNISTDNTELIYEDNIRGLYDFAHYLRRFGRSAIVDEPLQLREIMIHSASLIIQEYQEIYKNEFN